MSIDGTKRILAEIACGELITNPLENLAEQVKSAPGVAFEPDVIEALAMLREQDRASFESLRNNLKMSGVRVSELDALLPESQRGSSQPEGSPSASIILKDLGNDFDFFHAPDGTGYADVTINDHRETWSISDKRFKQLLAKRYFDETGEAPPSESLRAALQLFEARSQFDGPGQQVHLRVAGHAGNIYIDLGDAEWRAIEVRPNAWRIVGDPPVRFRRPGGYRPLPEPIGGASIDLLRQYLNVTCEGDFVLVVAWLIAALRHHGPYPVLVLAGEQGSAKSTFARLLRALVDPNAAPLRSMPKDEQDLFIAAKNGRVLAFDNLSKIAGWLSDALCRLATGGGFATRRLYSDSDETLINEVRPVILNGIEDFIERPDLADRAMPLTLRPIPDIQRKPESQLEAAFVADRPKILGALLDLVAHGLRELPTTNLEGMPRMADFALWSSAWETAIWPSGTFIGLPHKAVPVSKLESGAHLPVSELAEAERKLG